MLPFVGLTPRARIDVLKAEFGAQANLYGMAGPFQDYKKASFGFSAPCDSALLVRRRSCVLPSLADRARCVALSVSWPGIHSDCVVFGVATKLGLLILTRFAWRLALQAFAFYEQSVAMTGHSKSLTRLGNCYYNGRDCSSHRACFLSFLCVLPFSLVQMSCQRVLWPLVAFLPFLAPSPPWLGSHPLNHRLLRCASAGFGCKQNKAKALELWEKAARMVRFCLWSSGVIRG